MQFLSRLFAKRRIRSALEEFGDSLTPHAIPAAMRIKQSNQNRISIGVATAVLVTAHRFASGFQKSLSDMPIIGHKVNDRLSYDDLMIEAAAYCLFLLSRDYLPSEEDDDLDEDEELDEDVFGEIDDINSGNACANAIFLAQAVLALYMPVEHSDHFLERRVQLYTCKILPRDDRAVAELFSSEILSIIDHKPPQTLGFIDNDTGIKFGLAVGTYIPIFHQTHVAALREIVHNLFENADELLQECSP